MQTLAHLQVIIGLGAAILTIVASILAASFVVAGSFKRDWPPDWFGNAIGAVVIVAFGFGIAEGFLALTRYAIGS